MSERNKQTLYDLRRRLPSSEEFAAFMANVDIMNARAMVLITTSYVDSTLERLISTEFVTLTESKSNSLFRSHSAPLGSFSSKIALGHVLGMFGDNFADHLNNIRSIRNAFAHSMLEIDFEQTEIVNECTKLKPASLCDFEYRPDTESAREKFVTCSIIINTILMNGCRCALELEASGYRRKPWPDKLSRRHFLDSRIPGATETMPPHPPQS